MRRIVVLLGSLATVCLVAAVACFAIGETLLVRQTMMFVQTKQPLLEQAQEEANRLGRIGQALVVSAGPLAAAAVLAVVAILSLLAFRWELRRATPIR